MSQVTIKQLLEAGVHFGHQTSRWNPKMKKYIFGERNGIYIINLEITLSCLESALKFLTGLAGEGKEVLLVGTKKQAQEPLREAAERCSMPYVNHRWLGGMLTNFETVRKSVKRLDDIDAMEREGNFKFVTKKEVLSLKKEREKLEKNLKGIRNMRKLPGAIFIIDSKKEEIAIAEAYKLGIPIIAVLDTNCDPDLVDHPIPGNDDAIRAIKLFCDLVASSVTAGRGRLKEIAKAEEEAELAAVGASVSEASAESSGAASGSDELSDSDASDEAVEEDPDEKIASQFVRSKEDSKDKDSRNKPRKGMRKDTGKTK